VRSGVSGIGASSGFRLHRLKGEMEGFWSVTVSGNWRVIFRFEDGNGSDVDLLDYR
jgi:proteic killer suppression protein